LTAADASPPTTPAERARAALAPRLEAAAVLRRLGHAIVAHDVDDELFGRVTAQAQALLHEVEATPDRIRATLEMVDSIFVLPPPDGSGRIRFPDGIVTGKANPLGIAADITRDGDVAVLRATLGPAFEGAPGRAHGGVMAALMDEVMGFVLSINATPAYTGKLTVTYRAPTPLGVELEVRAKLHSHHGRKLRIEADAYHGSSPIAHGEGLFIAVDPERFATG
jgi:acyl-coenzyme A thioesterase PaaI-like protein